MQHHIRCCSCGICLHMATHFGLIAHESKGSVNHRASHCMSRVLSVQLVELEGFTILEQRQIQMSPQKAQSFYAEHVGKPFFVNLVSFMTSGPIWALLLSAPDAVPKWRAMMGPTNTQKALDEAPSSLRALYGMGALLAITYGTSSISGLHCVCCVRMPSSCRSVLSMSTMLHLKFAA